MTKKSRLLIVDDDPLVLNSLERLIEELALPLDVTKSNHAMQALEMLKLNPYDLILTDQRMPVLNGLELIERARSIQDNIHCLLMSGYSDFDMIVSAINNGHISGFIMKPWKITEVESVLLKSLQTKREWDSLMTLKETHLASKQDWVDAIDSFRIEELGHLKKQLRALSTLIHAKDNALFEHSNRVAALSVKIGKALSLPSDTLTQLEMAATLHDLGKIAIRDNIHYKSESLTDREYTEMKQHAEIGASILKALDIDPMIILFVEQHHERVDGKGYPYGLSTHQITLGAKILAVADAYDALTSDRIYRKGMQPSEALQILTENTHSLYDIQVVNALIEILSY